MLTMTPQAAEAVKKLVEDSPFDEADGGLRIAPGEPTPQGTPLNLTLTADPEPEDRTVETDGATLYVEPQAAKALDQMVLDARIEQQEVQFMLKETGAT